MSDIIYDKKTFDEAVEVFKQYKPVKIQPHLKDDFIKALSKRFKLDGVAEWHAGIQSEIKCYVFNRYS